MRFRKETLILIGILLLIGTSGFSYGLKRGFKESMPNKYGKNYGPMFLTNDLNLTPEQRDKVEKLLIDLRKDTALLTAQLQESRYKLEKLMQASKIDTKAIKAERDNMLAIEKKISDLRFEAELKFLEILTPEQRANYSSRFNMKMRMKGF